ncbi:MAG: sigma-70 family RNA polymerase sigma factor [Oscillospiraceae bacterium]|nr:sigma-70 family RNA polymerase sigma factor [Oscillospiraceae bacterium]
MTNEQLAVFIQQGGNDELIPILWERVRKLFYILSERYFKAYGESLTHYGVTSSDLKQESYKAFLKAVEGFKPDKSYKFTSYLHYPLKNAFRNLLSSDLLNSADSLNAPVGVEADGDNDELIDFISDDTANPEELTEQLSMKDTIRETVRQAVSELPTEEQELVRERYYRNRTLSELAHLHSVSKEAMRKREQRIFERMRENPSLQRLGADLGYDSCRIYNNSLSAYKRTGVSNVEYIAIERTDIKRREQDFTRQLEQLKREYNKLYTEFYSGKINNSQLIERERELDYRKNKLMHQQEQINLLRFF